MKKHSNTYEQYCCVLNKNVIMEEVVYYNGSTALKCTNTAACNTSGGCKNGIIKRAIIERENGMVCASAVYLSHD